MEKAFRSNGVRVSTNLLRTCTKLYPTKRRLRLTSSLLSSTPDSVRRFQTSLQETTDIMEFQLIDVEVEPLIANNERHAGKMPEKATLNATGYDLFSPIKINIPRGRQVYDIPFGLKMRVPTNTVAMILPRSSAFRAGLRILNGLIDHDYRGEVQLCVENVSCNDFRIMVGDRIAQMVFAVTHHRVTWVQRITNEETARGDKKFGSSGR